MCLHLHLQNKTDDRQGHARAAATQQIPGLPGDLALVEQLHGSQWLFLIYRFRAGPSSHAVAQMELLKNRGLPFK